MRHAIRYCIILCCTLPLLLAHSLSSAKGKHHKLRIVSDSYNIYICSGHISQERLSKHLMKKGLSDSSIKSLLTLAINNQNLLSGYSNPNDKKIRAILYSSENELFRACSYALQEQKVLEIGIKRELTEPDIHKAMLEAKNNPMTIYIIRSIKDQSSKSQHK